MAVDNAQNAAILAVQIMAVADPALQAKIIGFKEDLAKKIEKANSELAALKFPFKTN